MKETLSLDIGLKELVFLAALLDGDSLLGIEDPFQDSLAHQVEEEWERIAPLMEDLHYFKTSSDGDLEIEPDLAKLVRACCFPVLCLILSYWEKEKPVSTYAYYITPEMTVQKSDLEPSESCSLKVLPKKSSIIDSLIAVLANNDYKCIERGGGEAPAALIESIKKTYENKGNDALGEFVKHCPNFIYPELFLDDLLKPAAYSILVMTDLSKDDAQTSGFSLLKGEERLWKIRAFNKKEEDWLEISASNLEDIEGELNRLGRKVQEVKESKKKKK